MSARPYGADAVRRAVIDAARKRFAAEGEAATIRDIAADAQVNSGLLHRHFGNKADLLAEVLNDVFRRAYDQDLHLDTYEDAMMSMFEIFHAGDQTPEEYVRILAWMLLAGHDPRRYQTETSIPGIASLAGDKRRDQLLTALAAIFGWRIFGPFLSQAAGYASTEEASEHLYGFLRQMTLET